MLELSGCCVTLLLHLNKPPDEVNAILTAVLLFGRRVKVVGAPACMTTSLSTLHMRRIVRSDTYIRRSMRGLQRVRLAREPTHHTAGICRVRHSALLIHLQTYV